MNEKHTETLETLVDELTLNSVLDLLSDICVAKAEHIYSNYQDEALASKYESVSLKVSRAAFEALEKGL